ncbi:GntR family transcriptional regulator [Solitalea canadensis]|uniref:Transcriptional regulator n=1 Tax=Solitalea canadensis (strain ATCC 29591 / DSM 3403 / JCM 21819 / LMG 8368 / NBRC 15130 / NCIMB 12057 / USAM 9D) TaxID=929556 RepID=H8KTN5_SOLCM|nr:GntR family transcriptional regulator [Solitalea canadensis]AFD06610.1 transcriptional regulator [Solitalea canadensis DSM 3403]
MHKIPLLDHDSKIPLNKQAEDALRSLIQHPDFSNGALFPKETDLAQRWSISRNTLRQAINNLVKEGLLERKKRLGTRVTKQKIATNLNNWMSFTHEMESMGLSFKNLLLITEMKPVTDEVAQSLQIQTETEVICLKRVRSTDENPMVYFESYFHPRIGISENENFEKPLYELLDEKYNVIPVYSQEEIKAIAASDKIAEILKIKEGEPLLERKRLVLDAGRKPIEYNVCYYRSDWFTYSIEIKRSI